MSATLYSTLVPESELQRRTWIITCDKRYVGMTRDNIALLIDVARWTLEELERTRQLLAEVAPDLVRRFS